MSFLYYQSGLKNLYESWLFYNRGLPGYTARPKGTWNLYWCQHMTKYDEPGPHWCDCTTDGKWRDSTLSSPILHPISHPITGGVITPCNCQGARAYKYTPYCTLIMKMFDRSIICTSNMVCPFFGIQSYCFRHFAFARSIF